MWCRISTSENEPSMKGLIERTLTNWVAATGALATLPEAGKYIGIRGRSAVQRRR